LLVLDAWQRSGLPARDFAPLEVFLSIRTWNAEAHSMPSMKDPFMACGWDETPAIRKLQQAVSWDVLSPPFSANFLEGT